MKKIRVQPLIRMAVFSIKPDTGKLNITFQFIGYKSVQRSIDLRSNDTIELNVGLDMEIQEIGPDRCECK